VNRLVTPAHERPFWRRAVDSRIQNRSPFTGEATTPPIPASLFYDGRMWLAAPSPIIAPTSEALSRNDVNRTSAHKWRCPSSGP
jgi:hypothetical protein